MKRFLFVAVVAVIGYGWGLVSFFARLLQGESWTIIPLALLLAAGYLVVLSAVKGAIYIANNHETFSAFGNIMTNLQYLMQRAKQKDPGCLRLFRLLIMSPEMFRAQFST